MRGELYGPLRAREFLREFGDLCGNDFLHELRPPPGRFRTDSEESDESGFALAV